MTEVEKDTKLVTTPKVPKFNPHFSGKKVSIPIKDMNPTGL